jgi:hypothetical protein
MKGGIKFRFLKAQDVNPSLSIYLCFARAVCCKRFSRKQISLSFGKLVDINDFDLKDRKRLIDHLAFLTNRPNEGEIAPIFALKEDRTGWVW